MKNFVLICFILTLLVVLSPNVFSQAVCPINTLKVNKVNGKIVSKFNNDDVLPQLKVELRKTNDEETLVATDTTNEKGSFEFKEIRKGEYFFIVHFVFNGDLVLKYRAVVKVKRSGSSKSTPSILVRFAFDCWETEAMTIR